MVPPVTKGLPREEGVPEALAAAENQRAQLAKLPEYETNASQPHARGAHHARGTSRYLALEVMKEAHVGARSRRARAAARSTSRHGTLAVTLDAPQHPARRAHRDRAAAGEEDEVRMVDLVLQP